MGPSGDSRLLDEHGPAAVRILDFPHAAGYVSQIGQAVAQAGTRLPPTWLDEQVHTLKHEGPTAVLAALRQVAASHPQLEEVRTALAYLKKREGQMQYPCYQVAGWPIGSGIVESANKLVMQVRLKGAGMRLYGGQCQSHAGLTHRGVFGSLGGSPGCATAPPAAGASRSAGRSRPGTSPGDHEGIGGCVGQVVPPRCQSASWRGFGWSYRGAARLR